MADSYQSVYGITTIRLTAGLSAVTQLTAAPNVISQILLNVSGGTLWMAGQSVAYTSFQSLGVDVTALNLEIQGPAPLYFVPYGAEVQVQVLRKLGQGFAGQY